MIHKLIDGKFLLAASILCGCLSAAYGSYEKIYKATPDYSLHYLQQAAKQQQGDVLKQWIDQEAVSHEAYRGLVQFHNQQTETSLPILSWLPIQNEFESALQQ